jgi:hypothetical protein
MEEAQPGHVLSQVESRARFSEAGLIYLFLFSKRVFAQFRMGTYIYILLQVCS